MSKLIALCDGHGVKTAGKRTPLLPNGVKSELGLPYMNENLFNRAVVKYLDQELKNNGFKTILVAPTDADTPLSTRVSTANKAKADLYVSIHANANTGKWGNWGGIETYTWKNGESKRIGTIIHKELIKGSPLKDRGVKDGSWLYVIKNTRMPSILIEAGFMDSHHDYKYLLSDAYRRECAREIAIGICKAYGVKYKPLNAPSKPNKPKTNANTHKVIRGETLWGIAKKYNMTVQELRNLNKGKDLEPLQIGTVLNLKAPASATNKIGTVEVIVSQLWYYNKPDWNAKKGIAKKGEVFTVVKELTVKGSKMYKLKSGNYITANPKYVKFKKA